MFSRLQFVAAGLALTAAVATAPAQRPVAPSGAGVQEAAEALTAQLSLAQLRTIGCVDPEFANCRGGLEVVQDFSLGSPVMAPDTLQIPVRLSVLGVVASSEAALMFLPDQSVEHSDSATVTMIRRRGRWHFEMLQTASGRHVTSAAAAHAFFRFEADDRHLFDSTLHARRGSSARPATER